MKIITVMAATGLLIASSLPLYAAEQGSAESAAQAKCETLATKHKIAAGKRERYIKECTARQLHAAQNKCESLATKHKIAASAKTSYVEACVLKRLHPAPVKTAAKSTKPMGKTPTK